MDFFFLLCFLKHKIKVKKEFFQAYLKIVLKNKGIKKFITSNFKNFKSDF